MCVFRGDTYFRIPLLWRDREGNLGSRFKRNFGAGVGWATGRTLGTEWTIAVNNARGIMGNLKRSRGPEGFLCEANIWRSGTKCQERNAPGAWDRASDSLFSILFYETV